MSGHKKSSHLRLEVSSSSVQFDTSNILDNFLYLGGKGVSSNLEQLQSLNVGFVINCSSEEEQTEYPPDFHYMHLLVDDSPNADIGQYFAKSAAFIESAKQTNKAVFVHCTMGMSRSCSIVLAYLIQHTDMTLLDALEHVKARRPYSSPNPGFMHQLVTLEKEVKGAVTVDTELYAKSRFESTGSFRKM